METFSWYSLDIKQFNDLMSKNKVIAEVLSAS